MTTDSPSVDPPADKGEGDMPADSVGRETGALSPRKREERIVPVTELALGLDSITRQSLMLTCAGSRRPSDYTPDPLVPKGALVSGSVHDRGFRAIVSWALRLPEEAGLPLAITGKHELEFSVGRRPNSRTAEYYAEVNAVILAYPYIRELIGNLSSRALGRSIVLPPFDVPGFVEEWRARSRAAAQEEPPTGD